MSKGPRVTVGVTTYNVERYLAGALDALLGQDFGDFEVVICDNQSTDDTWEICQRYADADSRFRIHRNATNLGQAGNFARVLSLARGEYFRLTSHDDLIAPTLLRRCVEVLDANPCVVLAYPRTIIIGDNGEELCEWHGDRDLRHPRATRRLADYVRSWNMVNELFGLIRTDVLRQAQPFGKFVSADKRLLVELIVRGEFQLIPERLFYRRMHQDNTFGTRSTADQVYEWLEPELVGTGLISARYGTPRGDHNRLTVDTCKALLAANLPLASRLAAAATFVTVWQGRRTRIFLGHWKRRLLRTMPEQAPWAAANQQGG